ncbi:MAG: nucleotide-binding protein [Chloroflexi bacterium]|nr:nucleotide-binding protein [Chloroflexota bacterium]
MENLSEISQDAMLLRNLIAEYANPSFEDPKEDPKRGRYILDRNDFETITGWNWDRISDALELLSVLGDIKVENNLNGIRDAELTVKGRDFYQRHRLRAEMEERVEGLLSTNILDPNWLESQPHSTNPESEGPVNNEVDPRKVFVIHGRNEKIRSSIFDFLRAVGLDPIEWAEAVSLTGKPTPYVGEVLNAAFSHAHAIVVVMTPDDEAKLRGEFIQDHDADYERRLTPQPRQNVLIEAGMAMGRSDDRTILIHIGSLRPISDFAGRHYVKLDNSTPKRQNLVDRLKATGCAVNIEGKTDWHTVGDFELEEAVELEANGKAATETAKAPSSTTLSSGEVEILKALADWSRNLTVAELSQIIKEKEVKVEYYLDNLKELDLVQGAYSYIADATFFLTTDGRRYLVQHELI